MSALRDKARTLLERWLASESLLEADGILWALTCIVTIRTVMEPVLERGHRLSPELDVYTTVVINLHAYLSWVCLFAAMVLVVRVVLGETLGRSARLALLMSPVMILVPIVDFIATGGRGAFILYSGSWKTLAYDLLNLFLPWKHIDMVGAGPRVEIAIVTLSAVLSTALLLGRDERPWRRWLRGVGLAGSIYATVFVFGYLPAIYGALGRPLERRALDAAVAQTVFGMYLVPTLLIGAGLAAAGWREDRRLTRAVLGAFYPSRVLLYLFMLGFGFVFTAVEGGKTASLRDASTLWRLGCAALSICLLFAAAKLDNDLHDQAIDRVSNPERPLVSGAMTEAQARSWRRVFVLLSMVFGVSVDRGFFWLWLLLWTASSVYSAPPWRLRRVYPLGHLVLATIATTTFFAGGLVLESYKFYVAIQHHFVVLLVFSACFTLAHLKDGKDIAGDAAAGVPSLFSLVGRVAGAAPGELARVHKWTAGVLAMVLVALVAATLRELGALQVAAIAGLAAFALAAGAILFTLRTAKQMDRLLACVAVLLVYESAVWVRTL